MDHHRRGPVPGYRPAAGAAVIPSAWSFEPTILAGLIVAAVLYGVGWRRLHRRVRRTILSPWRAWCYLGGLAVLALALLSPLATLAEQYFYLHMAEHLLVLFVAPPLLWLGAPLVPVLWAFPRGARRPVGRLFQAGHPIQRVFHVATTPWVALTFFCLTTAIWHLPSLYSAAEGTSLTHGIEHGFFFAAALVLWWPVVHPSGGRRRLGYGRSILYLFGASLESSLIGAFLFFARAPVYPYYARIVHPPGMSVVEDQHFGGLIMWIIGGFIIGLAQIALFARFLFYEEAREETASTPRQTPCRPEVAREVTRSRPLKHAGPSP